jgi:PEP-CTERM putative exosortase interaction domain/autotransporter-associated beta strand repeat
VGIETALSGAGGLTKLGEGILTLSGTNSYAGGTEVQSGTLAIVNGVVAHSLADTVVGSVPDGTAAFRLEGGSLENRSAFLGAATGATGSATVVSGTWVVGSELVIGEAGTGSLILEGGSVAVSGTTTVGALAGSAGSLTLSGGELATQRVVQGAGDAVITLNGGTLRATADAADFIAGTVTIGSGGAHIDTEVHTVGLNALGGSGGLHKLGTGTLILSGGNTYAGDTHVASGTLVIGSGVSVSHAAGDVVVGGPNATLLLVGGEISSHSGRIGNELGSGGEVRMTGGVWTNGSDLFVGENGSGLLTLEGGTLVSSASGILGAYQDSFGSVTVTSGTLVSATDLDIADTGIGTGALVVQGGRVSNDTARLGDGGTASVSGGTWHNETLLDVGNGRLTISGGGVQSAIGRIGHSGGGGEAQITGGLWESAQLVVGHAGAGTLTVASGGQVWSESAVIGSGFGTDGSVVTVTEDGSQFIIADTLTVGDLGSHNQLVVRQGALVRIGDAPGETIVFSAGGGSDNLLRLDSGYVALFGDQTAYVEDVLLANDFIQVWDGAAWVTATGSPLFSAVYYATEAEAFAATGYGNLGGYTILTSVPEPGTSALVLLSLGTLAFARRRTVRRD